MALGVALLLLLLERTLVGVLTAGVLTVIGISGLVTMFRRTGPVPPSPRLPVGRPGSRRRSGRGGGPAVSRGRAGRALAPTPTGTERDEELRLRAWLAEVEAGAADRRFEKGRSLTRLGRALRERGRRDGAIELLRRWLDVAVGAGDDLERPEVRKAFDMLVSLYRKAERPVEAGALVNLWLQRAERGPAGAKTLVALVEQILTLQREKAMTPANAEALFRRWLALAEAATGELGPSVASALSGIARARALLGRQAEAEADCQRARLLQEQHLGPHHPTVLATMELQASILRATGREADAEALEERVRVVRGEGVPRG